MKELNITYYFGQIKPEYRGRLALFMQVSEEGGGSQDPVFEEVSIDSIKVMDSTRGLHSPMRTYIGVNEKAKPALTKRLESGDSQSAFDLDLEVVRPEIVERRVEGRFSNSELSCSCFQASYNSLYISLGHNLRSAVTNK